VKCPELCSSAESILELGAGTGLVGLTAAMLTGDGSRVVLTDNNDRVLDLLQRNVDINFAHKYGEFSPVASFQRDNTVFYSIITITKASALVVYR